MEQNEKTSGIKKTWGMLISIFLLVICGLAMYYSYLILDFFDKQRFIPIVLIGLPVLVIAVVYFTLQVTWNWWVALIIALTLLLVPLGYFVFIHNYCTNCSQQVDFISKLANYTKSI
ncbi:MAG TPA: hypothetical protein VI564_08030 [Candidatus Nanoarchaeia archaeon]|nr:hypothetical protein [Candidatus Nanoarchaeia archaeon]